MPVWFVQRLLRYRRIARKRVETVGQVVRGELTVLDDRLFPADDEAEEPFFPGRVLRDPVYIATHDETDEALLRSTVVVPTTREVVDVPRELFRPGFRGSGPGQGRRQSLTRPLQTRGLCKRTLRSMASTLPQPRRSGTTPYVSRYPRTEEVEFVKAEEFDDRFDRGEDISSRLDLANVRRPGTEARRVNVDFPPGWSSH